MSPFAFISIIVTLAALFAFISARFLRLPPSVGTMTLASVFALAIAALGRSLPGLHAFALGLFNQVDFHALVLHGLLAFLLFAGALHLNLDELKRQKLPVFLLATVGTLVAAALTGSLLWRTLHTVHLNLPLLDCFIFGALISPTDPIAVLDMLRRTGTPASLETVLGGESLFNDGVGAVLFFTLLDYAAGSTSVHHSTAGIITYNLLIGACGALTLGAALGYITYRLLRLIDRYTIEIMLTLALAMGGYALADALHLSAPLEVVAAGIVANSHGRLRAMSARTLNQLDTFWALLDEMLNVILFLLLGFALILVPFSLRLFFAGALAIPIVLLARGLSVLLIGSLTRWRRPRFTARWLVLTWGGLRGALSVALVLSLIGRPGSGPLLSITYSVVSFSVIVQGLTMLPLLRRLKLGHDAPPSTIPPPTQA